MMSQTSGIRHQTSDLRRWTAVSAVAMLVLWCGVTQAAETRPMRLASSKPRATTADVKAVASKAAARRQAERPKLDETVELKRVNGVVSGIGPGFIAVEFQRDEKKGASLEMALPVDEKALASQREILKTLKLGDTVAVEYQETTSQDSHGDSTRVKRAATAITLVKRAPESVGAGDGEGPTE